MSPDATPLKFAQAVRARRRGHRSKYEPGRGKPPWKTIESRVLGAGEPPPPKPKVKPRKDQKA